MKHTNKQNYKHKANLTHSNTPLNKRSKPVITGMNGMYKIKPTSIQTHSLSLQATYV